MNEMLFDPTLWKPDHLRELKGRQSGSGDQLHDPLPGCQGLFIVHGESYVRPAGNERAPVGMNPLEVDIRFCHHLNSALWFVLRHG
jgi:hypothetical protein